jgi:5-methylcytosine-specific restriction endonuclease McrA
MQDLAVSSPFLADEQRPCKYGCGKPARKEHTACTSCSKRMKCHGHIGRCGNANAALPGRLSPSWRGASVGYWAVHKRLRREMGAAREHLCTSCGAQALDWAYDGEDVDELISDEGMHYSVDPDHYWPMCRRCHQKQDEHPLFHGRAA